MFRRALQRAGITDGRRDAPHAEAHGHQPDDRGRVRRLHVMAVSGHSSTRMLARYTHPTEERKADAMARSTCPRVTTASQSPDAPDGELEELKELLGKLVDGRRLELPTSALRTRRSPN